MHITPDGAGLIGDAVLRYPKDAGTVNNETHVEVENRGGPGEAMETRADERGRRIVSIL